MGTLNSIANVWKNLQEFDLRPIREATERDVRIAIVEAPAGAGGAPGNTGEQLAAQMRGDPARLAAGTQAPILQVAIDEAARAGDAELIILLPASPTRGTDGERVLVKTWNAAGKKVLVLLDTEKAGEAPAGWPGWGAAQLLSGPLGKRTFLENDFANTVQNLLPDQRLALGRRFPLLRTSIAHQLINETCISNASYALGTGLAEVVPVLDLPLNIADIAVLTKGQALLVYKMGLALGLPIDWQYYVTEFGGVIGGGFLWRQIARSLIGLIPAWGIIPKVAIAYSGTYVVGQVVLQWYLTGRHVSREQMRELSRQAFDQGKAVAANLASLVPRPQLRLPRPQQPGPRLWHRRPKEITLPLQGPICKHCKTQNDLDASYCKHCGQPLGNEGHPDG